MTGTTRAAEPPPSFDAWTIPRTDNRVSGVVCASRGLRLFSRRLGLNEDAAGALRAGRENRSPVHRGRVGTMIVARVDDGRGAGGCLRRGSFKTLRELS